MLNDDLRARIEALDKQTLKGADRGSIRTKSLMADIIYEDSKYEPVYYMRHEKSDDKYISLKEVYMQIADPTEYQFATLCFYNYQQWGTICLTPWAVNVVAQWREELQIKLRSEAVKEIFTMTIDPEVKETSRLQALKWLADHGFVNKTHKNKVAKDVVIDYALADAERIGLKVVK
jgi:hypothetical protein